MHEAIGENRLAFAQNINEVAEEISTIQKDTERSRKQVYLYRYRYIIISNNENAYRI